MMFILLSVMIVILTGWHFMIRLSRKGILIDKIHGPKGYPLIGNIFDFLMGPVPLFYLNRRTISEYKRLHRVWVIGKAIINLYDPDDVEVLLSSIKHTDKSELYEFLQPWLGDGLLLSKGSKWHSRRKILTPAFHFNILKGFCKTFEEQSWIMINQLKNEIDPKGQNITPYITRYTVNAICETAMGTRLDKDETADITTDKYKDAIHILGELLVYRLVRYWYHFKLIFNMSSAGEKQKNILKTLHGFSTDVIRKRRKLRKGQNEGIIMKEEVIPNDVEEYNMSKKKRLAMLDLLLDAEAKGNINESGIREEVDTFMFEGHDTTSLAIIYTLMLLANNKEAQEKVHEEMIEIFGYSDRQATMEDLQNMRYLECCLKEALRLYPSVPFISRKITEDMQLKDYLIPAGTVCHVYIYDLHRNPEIYPSPDKFDPDRFLPKHVAGRHPFAYIPFSAGSRNCIGQRFAIFEEKSIISAIIRNFGLEAITKPDDLVFRADLVLRTTTPVLVKFIPRIKPQV